MNRSRRSFAAVPGSSRYAVRGAFPPEERAEMIDVDPEKLQFGLLNFYGDLDAYDGTPPTP